MQTYKKELKPYLYLGIFLFVIGFGIGNFFWLLPGIDYFSKTNYLFTKDILTYIEQTFYRFFITPSLLGFSVGILGFLLGLLMYVRDNDRGIYRHGEEYGSARFATPAEMKKYEDPIPENNIIVSKHVKISLFNKRLPIKIRKNKFKNIKKRHLFRCFFYFINSFPDLDFVLFLPLGYELVQIRSF